MREISLFRVTVTGSAELLSAIFSGVYFLRDEYIVEVPPPVHDGILFVPLVPLVPFAPLVPSVPSFLFSFCF